MIEIILISTVILLQIIFFIVNYGRDDERTRLRRKVELKTLRLSDKALDVQLHNTKEFVKNLTSEGDKDEKITKPIGFGNKD